MIILKKKICSLQHQKKLPNVLNLCLIAARKTFLTTLIRILWLASRFTQVKKISAASQALKHGKMVSNVDVEVIDQRPKKWQKNSYQSNESFQRTIKHAGIEDASKSVNRNNESRVLKTPVASQKELSFHRLAIKARLSEVMQKTARHGKNVMMDTINVIDDEEQLAAPENIKVMHGSDIPNKPLDSQESQVNGSQNDDVLYISDGDINSSTLNNYTQINHNETVKNKIATPSNDDQDSTLPYNIPEPVTERSEEPMKNITKASVNETCMELQMWNNSTNKIIYDSATTHSNENTFIYLDNLVKQFNLPSLKAKISDNSSNQSKICEPNAPTIANSETVLEIWKTPCFAYANEQSATDQHLKNKKTVYHRDDRGITNEAVPLSYRLSNYLDNYKDSKFDENVLETEMIASHNDLIENTSNQLINFPGSRFQSGIKSCSHLDSPKERSTFNHFVSEMTFFPCTSLEEEGNALLKDTDIFEKKFDELKIVRLESEPPEYEIKTRNVTTITPFYDAMSTLEIESELFKFGLKGFKRRKAVRVLNYLYAQMYPYAVVMETKQEKLLLQDAKCSKVENSTKNNKSGIPLCRRTVLQGSKKCAYKLDENVTQYFLPSKPREKVAWCTVPLHISFFNLTSENRSLRRQILRYEPVDLEKVEEVFKGVGLRYETKDLIAFLDKHCVTFRSTLASSIQTAKHNKTIKDDSN
uniref:Structure-specific endonuclease subunit SLX4 n=1 Tax=Anopheles farauti TaxID=69004 RepID=A0A182R092_9DIPT